MATKLIVNCGFNFSLGSMIEALTGETLQAENYIVIEKIEKGIYHIVDDNITDKDGDSPFEQTALGLLALDDTVTNLDSGSDEWSCFGISDCLQWEDVTVSPYEIHAPSISRIRAALQHIRFTAWCPGDI